jgi:hypothetical protein
MLSMTGAAKVILGRKNIFQKGLGCKHAAFPPFFLLVEEDSSQNLKRIGQISSKKRTPKGDKEHQREAVKSLLRGLY